VAGVAIGGEERTDLGFEEFRIIAGGEQAGACQQSSGESDPGHARQLYLILHHLD
jgi:hypothetical protein